MHEGISPRGQRLPPWGPSGAGLLSPLSDIPLLSPLSGVPRSWHEGRETGSGRAQPTSVRSEANARGGGQEKSGLPALASGGCAASVSHAAMAGKKAGGRAHVQPWEAVRAQRPSLVQQWPVRGQGEGRASSPGERANSGGGGEQGGRGARGEWMRQNVVSGKKTRVGRERQSGMARGGRLVERAIGGSGGMALRVAARMRG